MKKVALRTIIVFLCFSSLQAQSEDWKDIVPLRSARSDVRKLLGEPIESKNSFDKFVREDVKINIQYAVAPCKGAIVGWNVKAGTVLSMLVIPLTTIQFNDLTLESDFVRGAIRDDLSVEYVNHKKGVKYSVSEFGEITSIYYSPSERNESLRCKKH